MTIDFTEQELALGRQIIETCRDLERRGLNQGTSGNVSARLGPGAQDGFLITPTAMPYDVMQPGDMSRVRFDGGHSGRHEPSSEWRFHLDIYRTRPEAGAVIHTHSGYATTLACLRREIPAFHYMIALFGGSNIRCCEYATYGTQELSTLVLKALEGRSAALMGSHGLVVLGPSLPRALMLTVEAETLAMMYWRAAQMGAPRLLSEPQIAAVREKFATYGYGGAADSGPP
ncbi:MAG: class II aldolase/adducin family protein [Elusimicrobia bacterium]|nr:class II aldolase/adducin family protein [Elusimicrobiota bacterium]